jgi:hypothetical protein
VLHTLFENGGGYMFIQSYRIVAITETVYTVELDSIFKYLLQ